MILQSKDQVCVFKNACRVSAPQHVCVYRVMSLSPVPETDVGRKLAVPRHVFNLPYTEVWKYKRRNKNVEQYPMQFCVKCILQCRDAAGESIVAATKRMDAIDSHISSRVQTIGVVKEDLLESARHAAEHAAWAETCAMHMCNMARRLRRPIMARPWLKRGKQLAIETCILHERAVAVEIKLWKFLNILEVPKTLHFKTIDGSEFTTHGKFYCQR